MGKRIWYFLCIKEPHYETARYSLTERSVDILLKHNRCPKCKAKLMGVDVAFEREVHETFAAMGKGA